MLTCFSMIMTSGVERWCTLMVPTTCIHFFVLPAGAVGFGLLFVSGYSLATKTRRRSGAPEGFKQEVDPAAMLQACLPPVSANFMGRWSCLSGSCMCKAVCCACCRDCPNAELCSCSS